MTAVHEHDFPLDPMERAAAGDAEGVVVILGGTGTGKTHTIVGRTAALLEAGARPGHIACLTARSGSAADLRLRLERHPRTRDHLDDMFTGTIHECANDLLRDAGAGVLGISPGYTIWDHRQAVEMVHFVWPEYHDSRVTMREVREALDWHWRNQDRSSLDRPLPPRERLWYDVADVYRVEKELQNGLDLEDLIVMAVQAMERDRGVRERWSSTRTRHLLVDQAEELTPRQLRLLELMVGPTRSLTVATDPNQCIHQDAHTDLLQFMRLPWPEMRRHVLRMNQRSSRELWEMAVMLNDQPGHAGLWPDRQVCDGVEKGRPRLVEVRGALQDMYTRCLDDLQAQAALGTPWEDMAVLYRRNGAVRRMRAQLAHRDIPYTVLGGERAEKRGDATCVAAMLTCLANPRDLRAARIVAAPGYPNRDRILSPGASRLLRRMAWEQGVGLVEAAERNAAAFEEEDREHLAYLVQVRRDLEHLLRDPSCGLRDLLLRARAWVQRARPPGLPQVEDPDMDRLLRLCDATRRLGEESPRSHLRRFLDLRSPALHPDSAGPNQGRGVTFSTIHAAKGRRWRMVFVLDVSDESMPGGAGPHSSRIEWENRIFYTGVTRATEALYLYCVADTGRGNRSGPSRFLGPVLHLLERETAGRRAPLTGANLVEEARRRA